MTVVLAALFLFLLLSCASAPTAGAKTAPTAPAKVENREVKESDLATITLTPQAEKRLGIETSAAEFRSLPQRRIYAGEAVLPPGQTMTVVAPVAGTIASGSPQVGATVRRGAQLFRIQPLVAADRNLRIGAEEEVAVAKARLETARQRLARAELMLRDEIGSVKQKEAVEEEVRIAQANLTAAEARLQTASRSPLESGASISIPVPMDGIVRQIHANAGQTVPAGAPLAEIANYSSVWIRVPVYAGDVTALDARAPAEIRPLHRQDGPPLLVAESVPAPPTADPLASTVDLYYRAGGLRPGERVNVTLAARRADSGLSVPWSAIIYDIHGGAWLYEKTEALTYVRRRVDLRRVSGNVALVDRGLKPGAQVVSAGAAELFGTEFGPGK